MLAPVVAYFTVAAFAGNRWPGFSGGLTLPVISAIINLGPGMFAYRAMVAYDMHAAGHNSMANRRPVVAGLDWPLYVGLSLLAATLPQGSASLAAFPCVSLPRSCAPVLVLVPGISRYDSLALLYGGPSLHPRYAQALTSRLAALMAHRTATIGIAFACPGMVPTSQARSLHYDRSIATVSCASYPSAPALLLGSSRALPRATGPDCISPLVDWNLAQCRSNPPFLYWSHGTPVWAFAYGRVRTPCHSPAPWRGTVVLATSCYYPVSLAHDNFGLCLSQHTVCATGRCHDP
ncbi:hypothetical protein V6N13_090929 [Hibiscus sabdariffa]